MFFKKKYGTLRIVPVELNIKTQSMNKLLPLLFAAIVFTLFSCDKEKSLENSGNGSDLIVGVNCRISKIVYTDTAAKRGLGSIEAAINNLDIVTRITQFDSIFNVIDFIATPTYVNDTVYINADEYFVVDINKRISKLHGLTVPTDPFSNQYDVDYIYTSSGYLSAKSYAFTTSPGLPVYFISYAYAGGNLMQMTATDLLTGDLISDADISYYNNIIPKRYLYLFPDEKTYSHFNQYFNFGLKSYNAVKSLKIRNYDPGNVLRDSTVAAFSNYIMSLDNYVLSVQMAGDDQQSIPALAGKLRFSYKCK